MLIALVLTTAPAAEAQVSTSLAGAASVVAPGVGGAIQDTVILSDGAAPSGAISFVLYGPDGLPRQPRTVAVQGNGSYASGTFVPDAAGVWRFEATYTGDSMNSPAATSPGDPAQAVDVPKASPTLTVVGLPPAPGPKLGAVATLAGGAVAGGVVATGTIAFALYPPGDVQCQGAPMWHSSTTVFDNGTYPSGLAAVTPPGVYRWSATYSGDGNNLPTRTRCVAPTTVGEGKSPPPGSKEECKKDGSKGPTDGSGRSSRSQGRCVNAAGPP